MKQAVILAGGKGTRLGSVAGEIPKPMIPIAGKPLLEHLIENLSAQSVEEFYLFVGYKAEVIKNYFGDGSRFNIKIRYIVEDKPKGSAGSVLENLQSLDERFLIVYGDTLFNVDLKQFEEFHEKNRSDVSLFLHPNDHPYDSDLVEIADDKKILSFHKYPHPEGVFFRNLVNAALYICERKALEKFHSDKPVDFIKDVFPSLLKQNLSLFGYVSREYIKDMGTPERLSKVEADFKNGKINSFSVKRPAVFIDRDGTVTKESGFVRDIDAISLFDNAGSAVSRINRSNHLAVLVTNQPVVARGEVTEKQVELFHNKLETLLGREGAFLDAIYYCPHHPDKGFPGERAELKIKCDCRKPEIGMIKKADRDLNIDLKKSWFVGDMTMDILAAKNAGVRSILVRTGQAGRDRKYKCLPDYEVANIDEAVDFILRGHTEMKRSLAPIAKNIERGQFIVIGGAARTGKSLGASVIKELLIERGLNAHAFSLDSWLKPARERGEKVMERFDLGLISRFLSEVKGKSSRNTVILLPFYDRHTRNIDSKGMTLEITSDDIIILEGTIALAIDDLLKLPGPKLFVESERDLRRKRFWREYSLRGMNDSEITRLYDQRELEEIPFVQGTKVNAQTILNFDKALA